MASVSAGIPRSLFYCLALGGALLAAGAILLASESGLAARGLPAGPIGANLVVIGTVLTVWGIWLSLGFLSRTTRLILAGLLVAAGVGLWLLAASFEPLLMRAVAVAALVSGLGAAARGFGDLLPRIEHSGAMPLGEKLAVVSLAANAAVVFYLLVRTRGFGGEAAVAAAPSDLAAAITTLVVVVAVLFAESLGLRALRGKGASGHTEDERDIAIREAGGRAAYPAVVVGVVFLAAQIGLGDLSARTAEANAMLGLSSPFGLAHALIAVLFLSQCARSLAEIWQYERARF